MRSKIKLNNFNKTKYQGSKRHNPYQNPLIQIVEL